MINIVILAFDGCLTGAVTTPPDLFATANLLADRKRESAASARFRWTTVSETGKPVRAGSGAELNVEGSFADIGSADAVIVPGMMVSSEANLLSRLADTHNADDLLHRISRAGGVIAANCTGVFTLAETGLLDGRPATTTWWLSSLFRSRYPRIELDDRRLLVDAGPVITSAAGTSYLDLCLRLISRYAGPDLASQCASYLCLDGVRDSQSLYVVPDHVQVRDSFIERADSWIRRHLAEPMSIPDLSAHMSVSNRTLIRRFRTVLACTPTDYIQKIRVETARMLLGNASLSVSQVARRVGYEDEDAFRRVFRKQTQLTPNEYRRRIRSAQT